MFRIERAAYGLKLTFGDVIDAREMEQWVRESVKHLQSLVGNFGVFVDMRALGPLAPDARALMVEGRKMYKAKGMQRSAIILDNRATSMQLKRLAQQSGICKWERYIDATKRPDWEEIGVAWVILADDPDKPN